MRVPAKSLSGREQMTHGADIRCGSDEMLRARQATCTLATGTCRLARVIRRENKNKRVYHVQHNNFINTIIYDYTARTRFDRAISCFFLRTWENRVRGIGVIYTCCNVYVLCYRVHTISTPRRTADRGKNAAQKQRRRRRRGNNNDYKAY